MTPLSEVKQKILKCKHNMDQELFSDILLDLDYLILYYIKKSIRWVPGLKNVNIRDLYHTSIIGLKRFIDAYPEDWNESHIPCRLHAYMFCEFRSVYRYLFPNKQGVVETRISYNDENIHMLSVQKQYDEINTDEIDYKLCLSLLSPKEADMLNKYFTKTVSVGKIAEQNGVKISAMSRRIKRILKKLKEKNL